MQPEEVLELVGSAPERYDAVRAALRYRADGLKRKEIGERIVRTEAGRRAFQISAREVSEAISWPDGPCGWRSLAWHAGRYHWRVEKGASCGGVGISAYNGRGRLPIGGRRAAGLCGTADLPCRMLSGQFLFCVASVPSPRVVLLTHGLPSRATVCGATRCVRPDIGRPPGVSSAERVDESV